jgi:hypothetical protein
MSQVTVTGKTGGAQTVTAKNIPNVKAFTINCDRQTLIVTDSADTLQEYDISAQTTFTLTFSAGVYSLTVA